jgi:tetratricopeptide (TPR) repeat protein
MLKKNPDTNQILCILLITAVTLLAYSNVFNAGFISWDDMDFTIHNKDVHEFDIRAFFTRSYLGNYSPLTMISFSIDYYLGKENPALYHVHNILLHIINSILVFFLIKGLHKNPFVALFTAMVFALHPIQTESVSWISERKNLVCALYYILCMIVYTGYVKNRNNKNYSLVFGLFLLALFSKGMAVSIPLSLLAIDLWMDRKYDKKILLEKIPFFILSLIFGIIAIKAQATASFLKSDSNFTVANTILFSGYAYLFYLVKVFIPVNLSVVYPYPKADLNILYFTGLLLFFTSLLLFFYSLRKKKKFLAGSILFFVGNLFFVLQFIKQGAVLMADHYLYIALLGIVFPLFSFLFSVTPKNFIITICSLICIVLMGTTYKRNTVWKDEVTFWKDVSLKYPNSEVALSSLGSIYMKTGETTKALNYFNRAISINPSYFKAYYNRGLLYAKNKYFREAINDFTKATQQEGYLKPYVSRAEIYYQIKDYSKAFSDAEKVLKTEPDNVGANFIIANCYSELNQLDKALIHYNKCIALNNKEYSFYFKRAIVFGKLQKFNDCLNDLDQAIQLDPRSGEAFYWKGVAKTNLQQDPCSDFRQAYKLGFNAAQEPVLKYCH